MPDKGDSVPTGSSHKRSEKKQTKEAGEKNGGNGREYRARESQGIWNLRGGECRWGDERETLEYLERHREYDLKNASFLCSMGECRISTVMMVIISAGQC